MNTLILLASLWAIAQPEPNWSGAGLAGLMVYGLVALGTAWIEAHKDSSHRDDCAKRLVDIQASMASLLERGGDASCLRNGRRIDPKP